MGRNEFPLGKRHDALEELISIISELKFPVVMAHQDREVIRETIPFQPDGTISSLSIVLSPAFQKTTSVRLSR